MTRGPRPSTASRPDGPKLEPTPPSVVGAFFDVDGTLTRSDIVRDHVAFRRATGAGPRHAAWMATLPLRAAGILLLDQLSRTATNRVTYSWYAGFERSELARWGEDLQRGRGLARFYPRAWELLLGHARSGHRLVLLTGALDLIVDPLARLLERRLEHELGRPARIRVEAIRLAESQGRFTGRMANAPLGGAEKARRAIEIAREEGLDLRASHGYGDSIADLPLLQAVGRPAAVNPDLRLRRAARRRGWPVLDLRVAP